ncbi:MAG: metal-dependent hydrolase [Chlorobi bacterium OLB4]|jgi:Predicted Zn-dependent hydrolases of the beta-lactamase fold|nr:MAG: metal-dependent hydrolase [Chlorobi bacterium OLB4]MBW7856024.1 metal-dependent hydrolase [Ignavibacteria bacterium]OQY77390.1 MAG: metal-dependent hydrolase [Ignavibacteriales bacterium UTCHB1]
MNITYYGHSFLLIKIENNGYSYSVAIDPFITGNPLCPVTPDDLKCDYIILTHGHGDHFGDTQTIAKSNNATVIATAEISYKMESLGIKTHGMNIGGLFKFPFGSVKMTIAHHSSSMPDGSYAGDPAGVIIKSGDKTVYHAGDTALFMDMKLIGEMNEINHAFLPIGDNFTMGIDDAVKAAEFINAETITPIHYNTFDVIKVDAEEFKRKLESTGKQCKIMNPGDTIEI